MPRYDKTTTQKYVKTEHVYGTFDKEVVDAGIASGAFILMEATRHKQEAGRMIAWKDRRYFPASEKEKAEKKGWVQVGQSGAEIAHTMETTEGQPVKRGPGRPPKVRDEQ